MTAANHPQHPKLHVSRSSAVPGGLGGRPASLTTHHDWLPVSFLLTSHRKADAFHRLLPLFLFRSSRPPLLVSCMGTRGRYGGMSLTSHSNQKGGKKVEDPLGMLAHPMNVRTQIVVGWLVCAYFPLALGWGDPETLGESADRQRWFNSLQGFHFFSLSQSLPVHPVLALFLLLLGRRHLPRRLFLHTSSALSESVMRLCGNAPIGIAPLEGRPIFSHCVVSDKTPETDRLLWEPYGLDRPGVHASWDKHWNSSFGNG